MLAIHLSETLRFIEQFAGMVKAIYGGDAFA